jgi:hypothetical protein
MRILRHSKIAITMEIYTEVVSSATREALRKLGDQLGPRITAAGRCCVVSSLCTPEPIAVPCRLRWRA